jgi:radical SAM superfamily enzyme YgiQ (UPF0313 family)
MKKEITLNYNGEGHMLKVLLINPPMPYAIKGHLQTPLGLCYLSSVVKHIAESIVFDCNVSDGLEDFVRDFNPDVIGVSVLTATYNNAIKLIENISPVVKDKCVFIAGGIHASVFPEALLNSGFSLVIRGEGECTFRNVISSIVHGKSYFNLNGISYIDEKGIVINTPDAELIADLDTIPFPDRENLPFWEYEHESIITSRGCNYRCFYCSSSHYWGQSIRYRTAENVFSELKLLYESGRTDFYFCDDNFTTSHKFVREICERILSADMKIKWSALTRVDTIDLNLLRLMEKAGCSILSIGIESGLSSFNKMIKKTSVDIIKSAFKHIKEAGIKTRTTWIIGLGKSYEDEVQSLQLIKELLPDQVSVHCLIPFPNTAAWDDSENYGLILDKDKIEWDVMNMTYSPYLLDNVKFKHISKEQIISLIDSTRSELLSYGYDGSQKKFATFLDKSTIKVID